MSLLTLPSFSTEEEEQERGGLDHFASHDADRRRY